MTICPADEIMDACLNTSRTRKAARRAAPPEDTPAADKLPGRVLTTSEMQRNWDRKIFDPKGMLFMDLLRDGFFGMCIAIIGAGLLWLGFSRPKDWRIVGAGALTLFGGIFTLRRAKRAWRAMKARARS